MDRGINIFQKNDRLKWGVCQQVIQTIRGHSEFAQIEHTDTVIQMAYSKQTKSKCRYNQKIVYVSSEWSQRIYVYQQLVR